MIFNLNKLASELLRVKVKSSKKSLFLLSKVVTLTL